MHIGFDAKRAFTNTSGLGNYSRFVVSGLVRLFPEHRYTLFTPRINPLFANFYPESRNVEIAQPQGLARKAPALWRVAGMASEFENRKIEVFHGLSNELPYGISGSKTKLVVTIHDLIFLRYPELYRLPDRLIYKRKFADACKKANHIVAISEQTRQDIITYFGTNPSKISVIYQDCDPVFQQPLPEAELSRVKAAYDLPQKYILCVGTLEKRKNQLSLLKAWHQSGAADAYDLVLVGKQTAYAQELHTYISAHKLNAKVHFPPYIPFADLPAIYQLASLFVYPSVFEGFGIPIVEALNSGVPVISSTGSCFSEAGGEGSVYVNPDSVTALSGAIARVISDKQLQQGMRDQGLRHALKFRAEKTIPELEAVYRKVLG